MGALDYTYELPFSVQPGAAEFAIENRGEVPHELVLVRLAPGVTLPELLEAVMNGGNPDDFAEALGVIFAEPGAHSPAKLSVALQSGATYALVCA